MACYSSFAFLFFGLCSFSLTEVLGFSVELIHRDSSRSPFYLPTETHSQRVVIAIHRSINRAYHFNQSFISTNTIKSTVTPVTDQGEYLMSYSVGTPPFQQFGFLDTGSTLVWLQCKPCEICYNQTSPIFDPSKSTTYKTIPCTSDTCHSMIYTSCSSNDQQICQYYLEYFSQSWRTSGYLSLETLTLDSTSGSPIRFPNFVLGCGHNNNIPFQTQGSGIVGLGNGPLSFISQMGSSIGGKFSYCLVPMFPQYSSTSSKLNFGDDALVSGNGTVSTPLAVVKNGFYSLNMSAFSVGDNRIEFGGSSYSSGGNVVAVVDSGSTQTVLPRDLYPRLESAVAKVVNLERTKDPTGLMSLCYKATLEKIDVPIMTAHFNDADVQLNSLNTFLQVADEVVCLAFVSFDVPCIIFGNVAQQNFLVGYDLQKNIVSFKPTDCTKY